MRPGHIGYQIIGVSSSHVCLGFLLSLRLTSLGLSLVLKLLEVVVSVIIYLSLALASVPRGTFKLIDQSI